MTWDDVSMERNRGFVQALQELNNLMPQLYSAADFCEKSYVRNEKQMVMNHLQEYVIQALVNCVDHLGMVACKLNDLVEEETSNVSVMELKISCLHQQLLTCQSYGDKEGSRKQQLQSHFPQHHKHYIIQDSINKKVRFSPRVHVDAQQGLFRVASLLHPTDSLKSKSLSWHLGLESKSILKGAPPLSSSAENVKASERNSATALQLSDVENMWKKSLASLQAVDVQNKESKEESKQPSLFGSKNNSKNEVASFNSRNRKKLAALFMKSITIRLKAGLAS